MRDRNMEDLERSEKPERSENPLESTRPRGGHWKPALAALGAVLALALLMGLATGTVQEAIDVAAGPPLAASDEPPADVIEACNSYAARAGTSIVVEEGVGFGGAVREERASGAVASGTFFGMSEENRRSEAARIAYGACMERRGY